MSPDDAKGLEQVPSKLPAGRAVKVHELTDYVPDSVVSRILLKNAAGTITLFAFDAGQGLSEHQTPYDAVVQIVDGAATITIGGKEVPAVAGETVLMPANVPHALHASQRFKMVLTMIRG